MFECEEFKGNTSSGYGTVRIRRKKFYAHRLVWMRAKGPIPPGMLVLHECDNRRCINVAHLRLGTHADNSRDMMAKGRGRNQFEKGNLCQSTLRNR